MKKLRQDVVRITVDNTPTAVSLITPVKGNYSGNLNFHARAAEPRAVKLVEFGYVLSTGSGITWFNGSEGVEWLEGRS